MMTGKDFYDMPRHIMIAADRAIDFMDWTRIQKVMEFLDWKWARSNGVPELYELRESARDLCAHAYWSAQREGGEGHTGTGGIYVAYYEADQWFTVSFVLERGEAEAHTTEIPKKAAF